MNVIIRALSDLIKCKVDHCSSTKSLWKKFHGLYSTKHASQDKYHDVDCDSDEVDEEEATFSADESQD